ncbi:hypothetical protein WMF37_39880 [Sorangium sp. So ce291]|uniref:hypothetical protein n=1 Tax=Sorangium sp. So ce291 TaxID=3133294 RepID=UPI003F5E034A
MKTIKNILLCAPFFGLFAVTLPGCPNEPEEQPPVETASQEVLCDKMAECGELDESVTAEQCAAKLGPIFDAAKQHDVCGSMIERWESLSVCAAKHASTCEELDSDDGDDGDDGDDEITKDHPCFEESESLQQAIDEAEKTNPDASFGCLLTLAFAVKAATSPPHGSECTTAEECPKIQCPGSAGAGSGCLNGYCMTEEDACE